MIDFYEKRKIRDLIFSKVVVGILFFIAALLAWSAYGRYVAERETRDKRLDRTEELEELKMREQSLSAKVERMETEEGVETALREQYDIAKPGEEVIVVVDKTKEHDENAPERFPLPPPPSLLERLKFW